MGLNKSDYYSEIPSNKSLLLSTIEILEETGYCNILIIYKLFEKLFDGEDLSLSDRVRLIGVITNKNHIEQLFRNLINYSAFGGNHQMTPENVCFVLFIREIFEKKDKETRNTVKNQIDNILSSCNKKKFELREFSIDDVASADMAGKIAAWESQQKGYC